MVVWLFGSKSKRVELIFISFFTSKIALQMRKRERESHRHVGQTASQCVGPHKAMSNALMGSNSAPP